MNMNSISEEDARAKAATADQGAPIWRYFLLGSPAAAVAFANLPPAQGAGEACFSVKDSGLTDTFLFF